MEENEFSEILTDLVGIDKAEKAESILKVNHVEELEKLDADVVERKFYQELKLILENLYELGFTQALFAPEIVRGLEYYDGMVFESFDMHPDNNRALFGGGRYNGLADLFVNFSIPAVGFAPGDETMKLFLENWDLFPKSLNDSSISYLPHIRDVELDRVLKVAKSLRDSGEIVVITDSEMTVGKAIQNANKQGFKKVYILGPDEIEQGIFIEKDMASGEEKKVNFEA